MTNRATLRYAANAIPLEPDERVDLYLASRNLAANTLGEYRRDLNRFGQFIQRSTTAPYTKMYAATTDDIQLWIASLRKNNEPQSLNRKLVPLRAFFKWQFEKGLRAEDPMADIKPLRAPRRTKTKFSLSKKDVARLLAAPQERQALRDRAILHLLYAGPKRHEIPGVLLGDFDYANRQIRVNGRIVPLTDEAAEAIQAYKRSRKSNQRWLFVKDNDEPMKLRGTWDRLKKYVRQCGLRGDTDVEALRTSYAVHALEDGKFVGDVVNAMGITYSVLGEYVALANPPRTRPTEELANSLVAVTPLIDFSSRIGAIRAVATSAVIAHGRGDAQAPLQFKKQMLTLVKHLEDATPAITTDSAFSDLSRHARRSEISDFEDILTRDLPALEAVAVKSFTSDQSKKEEIGLISLFHARVTHASLQHYRDGNYREAVSNAMIALTELTQERAALDLDGAALVSQAFKIHSPILHLGDLRTQTGRNEHEGFFHILLGAFKGIRNPSAHSMNVDLTERTTAQYLVLVSLLMRRVEQAHKPRRVAKTPQLQNRGRR